MKLLNQMSCAACALAAGLWTFAGPLDQSAVAREAKWVLHLDLDAFRDTALGKHVLQNVVQPKIEEQSLHRMNLSISPEKISAITAYGSAFEKDGGGVMLLTTSADVKKDMDTLVGMAALSEKEKKDVTMVQQKPYALYSLNEDIFVAPGVGNRVLLAKSRQNIDHARKVLLGEAGNLAEKGGIEAQPHGQRTFLVAMAEGFNQSQQLPPQANVLKETRGGRLALWENEQNLFLQLAFRGKDAEATTRIQQVLQGLVALVSLSQKDQDLVDLASRTKIAAQGEKVTVELHLPVEKVIQKIGEKSSAAAGN